MNANRDAQVSWDHNAHKDGDSGTGMASSNQAKSWINDMALGPFTSGVLQGFVSVAMQRRREKKQEVLNAAAANAAAVNAATVKANEQASVESSQ